MVASKSRFIMIQALLTSAETLNYKLSKYHYSLPQVLRNVHYAASEQNSYPMMSFNGDHVYLVEFVTLFQGY